MKEFLIKHYILLIGIVLYLIIGQFSFLGTYLLSILLVYHFYISGKYIDNILHLFAVFMLSDRIEPEYDYFDNLRIVCLLFLTFLTFVDINRRKYRFNKLSYSILPFFCSGIISLLSSPVPFISFQRILSFLLLYFVIANNVGYIINVNIKIFLKDTVIFAFVAFVISIFIGIFFIESSRLQGIFGNPNGLGLFCFIIFPYYYLATNSKYKLNIFPKTFKFFFIIVFFSCLLWSNSRNSILGLIVFYGLVYMTSQRNLFYRISLLFSGVLAIYILYAPGMFLSFVDILGLTDYLRLNNIENVKDLNGRLWSWNKALEMIPERLFFGGGMYYESYIFPKIVPIEFIGVRGAYAVWNSYLVFLLNVGIIGTLSYLLFLIINYIRSENRSFAFAFIVACLITGISESWLTSSLNNITIFLFIMLVILQNSTLSTGKKIINV